MTDPYQHYFFLLSPFQNQATQLFLSIMKLRFAFICSPQSHQTALAHSMMGPNLRCEVFIKIV